MIILAGLLSSCTGRGGGWLPPDNIVFSDRASFGFSFSCERSSNATNLQPKPAWLHIELSYIEHGTYTAHDGIVAGGPFSIHGVADSIDPVTESMLCTSEEPIDEDPVDENRLVFLGRYRLTSASSNQFAACQTDTPQCRFEVIVEDNDRSNTPSTGDYFSLTLSGMTTISTTLDGPLLYARGGELAGGNLTVD